MRIRSVFIALSLTSLIAGFTPVISHATTLTLNGVAIRTSFSSEISEASTQATVAVAAFHPGDDAWISIASVDALKWKIIGDYVARTGTTEGVVVRFKMPNWLPIDHASSLLQFVDEAGNLIIDVQDRPRDFPQLRYFGAPSVTPGQMQLMTLNNSQGIGAESYPIAIDQQKGIRYFERYSGYAMGLRYLTDAIATPLPSGTPTYAWLGRNDDSRLGVSPGTWYLLDKNFQRIGRVNAADLKIPGVNSLIAPEGHGIALAPDGNLLTMYYVPRTVNATFIGGPASADILDCVAAVVVDGVAKNKFSLWDYSLKNPTLMSKVLHFGENFDSLKNWKSGDIPVDFCHINSMQYQTKSKAFIISYRNIDLILSLSADLSRVISIWNYLGVRQHFARLSADDTLTFLANGIPGASHSTVKYILKASSKKPEIHSVDLPYMLTYCGNASFMNHETLLWVGDGCGWGPENRLGTSYVVIDDKALEFGGLETLPGSTDWVSYRIDLAPTPV